MNTVLATILFSILSSVFTYMFTRKKLQSDIITTQIENNTKQLEFYIKLVDDYKSQLKVYMKKGDNTELEVLRLRRAISGIINDVCISRNCPNRKYLNNVRIHEILKGDDSETE